jgi:hypothetical protein
MKTFCILSAIVLLAATAGPHTTNAQMLTTIYATCNNYVFYGPPARSAIADHAFHGLITAAEEDGW